MTDRTPSARPGEAEVIDVTIPARPDYVAVARLAAAGVAGRLAFSYDDVEDIKVAVGEACSAAIRMQSRQVRVRFIVESERLVIEVTHDTGPASLSDAVEADEATRLGLFLIRCLMDEVELRVEGSQAVVSMAKRLAR